MRSWVGLYKTLHIATLNLVEMLDRFKKSTAGKESKYSLTGLMS